MRTSWSSPSPRERFLAACRQAPVDRPPVWIMRQAGRYLPEYHEVRRRYGFWDILRSPTLTLELARQPLRRFELDAAIVFSDILVLLDAVGAEVAYEEGGPKIGRPFAGQRDLDRVREVKVRRDLAYVGEAVERLAADQHPDRAVIGFCGAPLTLAAYLLDGGPRSSLRGLKALYYRSPPLAAELLDALADAAAELLLMQIDAGADAVQIFDSWAGYLGPGDYLDLALPPLRRLVDKVRARGVPVIVYLRGAASHLETAASTRCDVLSIDQSLSLVDARRRLGLGWTLQGNLDPAVLEAPPAEITRRVHELLDAHGPRGLIVNLGQGLSPDIPVEGVAAFTEAVTGWQGVDAGGDEDEWEQSSHFSTNRGQQCSCSMKMFPT